MASESDRHPKWSACPSVRLKPTLLRILWDRPQHSPLQQAARLILMWVDGVPPANQFDHDALRSTWVQAARMEGIFRQLVLTHPDQIVMEAVGRRLQTGYKGGIIVSCCCYS